jgi:hypothetical protein
MHVLEHCVMLLVVAPKFSDQFWRDDHQPSFVSPEIDHQVVKMFDRSLRCWIAEPGGCGKMVKFFSVSNYRHPSK